MTIAVLSGAVAASSVPTLAALAVGERAALAEGEFWRLWTAHLVHFSPSHLMASGLVWLIAGGIMERRARTQCYALVLAGAPLVTWAALAGDAELGRYGGLSGLAAGAVVSTAIDLLRSTCRWRRSVAAAVLTVFTAKLWLEISSGAAAMPLLARFSDASEVIRVAAFAHLAGAGAGLAMAVIHRVCECRMKSVQATAK